MAHTHSTHTIDPRALVHLATGEHVDDAYLDGYTLKDEVLTLTMRVRNKVNAHTWSSWSDVSFNVASY